MKAAIVSIGNELLNGQTVDTNTTWLCDRLSSEGIAVVTSCTIGDDIDLIVDSMKKAAAQAEIILITGGLGPTDDDLTRHAIAKYLNVELALHPEIIEKMQNFFKARGCQMPEKNKIQAYLPKDTFPIENTLGTADGIFYKDDKKIIAAMPGVPIEMKQMFEDTVLGEIKKISSDGFVVIKKLKCFGLGESTIAEKLGDLMTRDRNPVINCTVDCGIITLHVVASAESKKLAEKIADEDQQMLKSLLGEIVYGTGNQSLAEVVGAELARQGKTLTLAESCTGGLIAKWITDVPGASKYFTHGWVTYSNEAKIAQLDVSAELVEKYGAVSSEVAAAMAQGARKKSGADYAIAVTGIAGPDGGTEQKPVGLVYIAVDSKAGTGVHKFNFVRNNRDFIRTRTAQTALNLLRFSLGI